jgi:hypothetical protein
MAKRDTPKRQRPSKRGWDNSEFEVLVPGYRIAGRGIGGTVVQRPTPEKADAEPDQMAQQPPMLGSVARVLGVIDGP